VTDDLLLVPFGLLQTRYLLSLTPDSLELRLLEVGSFIDAYDRFLKNYPATGN